MSVPSSRVKEEGGPDVGSALPSRKKFLRYKNNDKRLTKQLWEELSIIRQRFVLKAGSIWNSQSQLPFSRLRQSY